MVCPICKKPVEEAEPSRPKTFPFCSERCKLIDLGRWLEGKYQISESAEAPDDPIDPGHARKNH